VERPYVKALFFLFLKLRTNVNKIESRGKWRSSGVWCDISDGCFIDGVCQTKAVAYGNNSSIYSTHIGLLSVQVHHAGHSMTVLKVKEKFASEKKFFSFG
jgi:hypothetical protein